MQTCSVCSVQNVQRVHRAKPARLQPEFIIFCQLDERHLAFALVSKIGKEPPFKLQEDSEQKHLCK